MFKKILALVGTAVMMLGVFGLAACTESLDKYKATKSTELQAYGDAKSENGNYCEGSLAAICNAVTAGKKAIADATTKPAVTTAYNDAKGVIDAVDREDEMSASFYSLEDAYEKGLLSKADLENIAYYYNNRLSVDFPEALSEDVMSKIKQTYLDKYLSDLTDATLNHVLITNYYGTYNGSVAVGVKGPYKYDLLFIDELIVGGVSFFDYTQMYLSIWHSAE